VALGVPRELNRLGIANEVLGSVVQREWPPFWMVTLGPVGTGTLLFSKTSNPTLIDSFRLCCV